MSPTTAMWQPYPGMLVLHVSILAGFAVVMPSGGSGAAPGGFAQLAPVLILWGLKTAVDLVLHLWERSRASTLPPATTG